MHFVFLITIFILFDGIESQQCVDENGNSVDWYAIYKLPKIHSHPVESIEKGIAYLYVTSKSVDKGWTFANTTITDAESLPAKTLSVLIGNDVKDIFWIFYNDRPPNEPYAELYGHTKGVVVGGRDEGFWLVHSVPNFPVINRDDGYVYPATGTTYGQNFLCISFGKSNLDDIGIQLMVNEAYVFESSFQSNLGEEFPQLKRAAGLEKLNISNHQITLPSIENEAFVSFAKSKLFDRDLYSQWLSDVLRSELFVETWLHDQRLPSACNETYPVHNIQDIKWPAENIEFVNFKDHSKWTVSAVKRKPWICIGDINRASPQFLRGGGTVCLKNVKLWKIYRSMIAAVEPCATI